MFHSKLRFKWTSYILFISEKKDANSVKFNFKVDGKAADLSSVIDKTLNDISKDNIDADANPENLIDSATAQNSVGSDISNPEVENTLADNTDGEDLSVKSEDDILSLQKSSTDKLLTETNDLRRKLNDGFSSSKHDAVMEIETSKALLKTLEEDYEKAQTDEERKKIKTMIQSMSSNLKLFEEQMR